MADFNRIAILNNTDGDIALINDNFTVINEKIDDVLDELNYMNLYRLVGTISGSTQSSDFATLNVNEGRIWTTSSTFLEHSYAVGDYIIKTRSGMPLAISGPTSGAYVPTSLSGSTLTFSYTDTPGATVTFSAPAASANGANQYARVITVSAVGTPSSSTFSGDAGYSPVVSCYVGTTSSYGPEIDVGATISFASPNYTITLPAYSSSYIAIVR